MYRKLAMSDVSIRSQYLDMRNKLTILLIRQILKSMHHPLIPRLVHARGGSLIPLLIPPGQRRPQHDQINNQQRITPQMRRKRNEVPRRVVAQKHLGSDGVARGPGDEVHGDGDGFFRLARDVAREERHAEVLGRPEGEADVVGEEEAGFGGFAGVGDGHEDDCAGEGACGLLV